MGWEVGEGLGDPEGQPDGSSLRRKLQPGTGRGRVGPGENGPVRLWSCPCELSEGRAEAGVEQDCFGAKQTWVWIPAPPLGNSYLTFLSHNFLLYKWTVIIPRCLRGLTEMIYIKCLVQCLVHTKSSFQGCGETRQVLAQDLCSQPRSSH